MTMKTSSPLARVGRNSVTITSLVATLAAGVAGCSSSMERHGSVDVKAGASMTVDVGATEGRFGPDYFAGQVREYGAPAEWAESAGSIVTAVEAQRASAEATRVRAAADHAAALAEANRLLSEAVRAYEVQSAAARRLSVSAEAGYTAQERELAARELAFQSEVETRLGEAQAALDAAVRRADEMRVDADRVFEQARAEHERRLIEAAQAQDRARVTIEQMRTSAGAVMSRAEAEVLSLRAQAESRRATGAAEAGAHAAELEARREWAAAAYGEAQRELEAIRSQTSAEVESIRAQAKQIEQWELDEKYAAAVAAARSEFETATARATLLRESATTELGAAAVTLTTDRKELASRLERDGLAYEAELARIESDTKIAEARASIGLARAQELEHDARAQLIAVLAEAVGGETRGERSEAFAWAQGFADEVSQTGGAPAGLNLDSPEITAGIHAFIAQLGEARQLRADADEARDTAKTAAIMRRSQIEVWWNEARASAEAALEGIAHAEAETVEAMRQRFADADEIETDSRLAFEQASLEAESAKQEAYARLEGLQQKEAFVLRSGESRAVALAARAVSIREEGAEDVARLSRMAEAARAEGMAAAEVFEAQAEQSLAQARVESASFMAMAGAAESTLGSEYEARAAEAGRMLASARADYDEAMRVADTLVAFAEATRSETVASIEFEAAAFESDNRAAMAEARSTRDETMAAAEAALAKATSSYAAFQADDTARRSEAEAIEQALLAFVEEQHAVADAQDAAVVADFGARMAVLQADRDRAYADAYFKEFLAEAGLSTADMKRYVETANAALGRLRDASGSYAAPAVAVEGPAASGDGAVGVLEVESMSANGVATVPTDGDE